MRRDATNLSRSVHVQRRQRDRRAAMRATTLGRSDRARVTAMLPNMIEANSLTKDYGSRIAVRDVSFRCEPGTVTGFLGPNGAGKSTTLKMLCGLAAPTSGHAALLGTPFAELP